MCSGVDQLSNCSETVRVRIVAEFLKVSVVNLCIESEFMRMKQVYAHEKRKLLGKNSNRSKRRASIVHYFHRKSSPPVWVLTCDCS
jgi:hypothetical protein